MRQRGARRGQAGLIESPLLQAPGTTGSYDPRTNTAGLAFDLGDLLPNIFKPTRADWRKNLVALHEWAHFYQFATTTYGFLYQTFTFAQAYMVNGLLSLYDPRKGRCRLPLLASGATAGLVSQPPWHLHLRISYLLEQLRNAVYGYAPFPEVLGDPSGEWMAVFEVLSEICGTPKIVITRTPGEAPLSGAHRYRIDDLLESHAHALSSIWLMQIVERDELPRCITDELLQHANEVAVGPYRAFLQHALPVPDRDRMYAFCALCDIALNPPGFHIENQRPMVLIPDQVWSPVERMWRYMALTQEGRLPVPNRDKPGFEWEFLKKLKDSLTNERDYVLPFSANPERKLEDLREKTLGLLRIEDVPEALSLTWLDRIQAFSLANAAREQIPLILAGNHIQDLEVLIRSVGGPVAISRLQDRTRLFPRICTGLIHLGILTLGDSLIGEHVVRAGIAQLEAVSRLLYMTRGEIEKVASDSVFMEESLTAFLERYHLTLADFD